MAQQCGFWPVEIERFGRLKPASNIPIKIIELILEWAEQSKIMLSLQANPP